MTANDDSNISLRPKQKRAFDVILDMYESDENVVLVAPNGFGKTHLAGALAHHYSDLDGVAYSAPTHLEIEHAKNIFNNMGVQGTHLMSKNHLCTNKIIEALNMSPSIACQALINTCQVLQRGECEYFKRRDALRTASNVFMPHAYLSIEPEISENKPLILDEIHQYVAGLTQEQRIAKTIITSARQLSIKVPYTINLEAARKVLDKVAEVDSYAIQVATRSLFDRGKHQDVNKLGTLVNYAKTLQHGAKLFDDKGSIMMVLNDPASLVPKNGTIGMTGTLTKLTQKVLTGFKVIRIKGYSYDNLKVTIDSTTTTQHSKRSANRTNRDFRSMYKLITERKDTHIMVLGTSKTSSEQIALFLNKVIRDRRVICATGSHSKVHKQTADFRANGGILVSVLRGRVTEGIDIPEATFMIVYGLPFLPMTQGVKYYIEKFGFGSYYVSSAIAATSQAIGRGIRSPTDAMTAILMDERYVKYANYFPEFQREKLEVI